MGGDRAPALVVDGADIAIERLPDMRLVLVGDEARLRPLIDGTKRLKRADYEILHTDEIVGAAEKPSVALRSGRKSSMRTAGMRAPGTARSGSARRS